MRPTPFDLIPPGHKPVDHQIAFEVAPALEAAWLVLGPTRGFGGFVEVTPGATYPFSSKYATRLYVLPEGATPPAELARETLEVFPSAGPFAHTSSVSVMSPLQSLVTTYRLTGLEGETARVQLVDEVRFDGHGAAASAGMLTGSLLALALLGALGLAALARSGFGIRRGDA